MLDLVEAIPKNAFGDISREEVIDWIEIDDSAPVVEEISASLIIQSVLTPQDSQIQEVESDEEGAVVEESKVSWKQASDALRVDVRCYCNLPMCVSSNYMCRSSEGVCVSERGATEAWSWRHACIELITIDARQMATLDCKKNDTRQCCMNDMCNYFWKVPSNRNQNHTYITGYLSNHDTSLLRGGHSVDPQPWFKVTVVAVPVAGGLILITLIVMAVKMLRAESLRQTRLKPIETHHVVYQTRKNCFPKSASCVLLSSCHTGHIVRSYASMGTLERADSFCRSSSFALSTDSGCSDSSKEKYFVFDV